MNRAKKHRNKDIVRLFGIVLFLSFMTGSMAADIARAETEMEEPPETREKLAEDDKEETVPEEEPLLEEEEKKEEQMPQKYVMPVVRCPDASGERSWYSSAPEITILHYDKNAVTVYTAINAGNEKKEDTLKIETAELEDEKRNEEKEETGITRLPDGEPAAAVLDKEFWKEGKNTLTVRMESPEGEELFRKDITIFLDQSDPAQVSLTYTRPLKEGILYSASGFAIRAEAEDTVSGVERIIYRFDNGTEQVMEGGEGIIQIPAGYAGKVSAYAVDHSGRSGASAESPYIVCEDQAPEIRLDVPDGFDAWYRDKVPVDVYVEDNKSSEGTASGIAMVTCYINKKMILQETYGVTEEVYDKTLQLSVSPDGQEGISEIAVHVKDHAGNSAVKYGHIRFDTKAPSLSMEGVYDTLISSGEIKAVFKAEDSGLASVSLCVAYTDIRGKSSELMNINTDGWTQKENGRTIEKTFEADGKYECRITAADAAGNRTEQTIRFVIDSASPVIRYVDQMEGLTIPYFQWDYGREDMIRDFTDYSYQIRLNGKPYLPGSRVTDEGVFLLAVSAVDAAGNQALAEAVFEIDHTPPRIIWGEEMNQKVYTERVTMSVWVDGEGERLRRAVVNGEPCRLRADSRIFQYDIEEPGGYHVQIFAEDLAGNVAEEEVTFTVKKRQSFVHNFVNPVIEKVKKYTGKHTDSSEGEGGTEKKIRFPACAAAFLLTAASLVPAGYYITKKRRGNRVLEEKDP